MNEEVSAAKVSGTYRLLQRERLVPEGSDQHARARRDENWLPPFLSWNYPVFRAERCQYRGGFASGEALEEQRPLTDANRQARHSVVMSRASANPTVLVPAAAQSRDELLPSGSKISRK
ncbi:hypothetical protein [Novosphingobium sp.]|uniref:hypothetical protein n=1 Tax=Novosphingobium sp. TaxID=1874826 RepID=UPI002FE206FC